MAAFPVQHRVVVQWGDLDALGHVNHARYLTWMESARIELLRRAGVTASGAVAVGPILARAACDYLRPVHFPGDGVVGARVARLGRTSVTLEYEITVGGQVHARGETVVVLFDYRAGVKVALPDDVRHALEALT